MHKRIEPHQVELGMYIHRLEGSWFDHPFWRARFLLTDPRRLERLRDSLVPGVIIDTSLGRDLGGQAPMPGEGESAATPDRPLTAAERLASRPRSKVVKPRIPEGAIREIGNFRSAPPQSLAREFGQALAVADRSKKVISRVFLKLRLGKDFKTTMVEPVIEDIFTSIERNPHAFNGLMRCQQDSEMLYRHALATSALMITLGRQLRLPAEQLRQAGLAGLMCDVGIAQLPIDLNAIGQDPSRIPDDIMAGHVELGCHICEASGVPEPITVAVSEHHERMDGKGYPFGRKRAELSLLGRMAAICDAYDDLCNDGAGEHGMNPAATLAQMRALTGAFDPDILNAFIEAMGIYPIGAVLLLRSGRLAMVVDQNPAEPAQPIVVGFYSTISGHKTAPETLDLTEVDDAIEAIASPEAYGIADFEALRAKLFAHACSGDDLW